MVAVDFIQKAIDEADSETASPNAKVCWLGGAVSARYFSKKKKGQTFEMAELTFFNKKVNLSIQLKQDEGKWLVNQIPKLSVGNNQSITYGELAKSFEAQTNSDFVLFWNSPAMKNLRENGLLIL